MNVLSLWFYFHDIGFIQSLLNNLVCPIVYCTTQEATHTESNRSGLVFFIGCQDFVGDLVTYLNQTPKFEWCVAKYGTKNRDPKNNVRLVETKLYAQNMLTTLGLDNQHKWRNLYDHRKSVGINTLIFIRKSSYELRKLSGNWLRPRFGILPTIS